MTSQRNLERRIEFLEQTNTLFTEIIGKLVTGQTELTDLLINARNTHIEETAEETVIEEPITDPDA